MGEQPPTRGWLAKGGALGFLGAATSAILGFLTTVLITRLLGSDGAGVVIQATAVFAIVAALSKLGMDSTAIFLLPRVQIDSPQRIRSHLILVAAVTALVSLFAAFVLNLLSSWLWGQADGGLDRAVSVIAWFIPTYTLLLVVTASLRALGGMREYVLTQNIALPLLRPIAIIAVSALASTLVVTLAWAVPIVVVLAVAAVLLWRKATTFPADISGIWPTTGETRRALGFAVPRTLAAGLEQALVWLDVIIIGMLIGNAAAGIYGGAGRFIQAGMVVDTALRVVVSPRMSALVHRRRLDELLDLHTTATMWLVLFACPVYTIMAVFAPTLMAILGEGFVLGAPVLVVLSLGAGITFLAGNIHTLLIMSGHSGWAAANKVIVLVVNVVGIVVLVPTLGILGAAWAWAGCMILDAILATIQVRRFLGITLHPTTFLIPLGIVTATVAAPSLLVAHTLGQGFGPLAVASTISVVLFSLGCYLLRERFHLTQLRSS